MRGKSEIPLTKQIPRYRSVSEGEGNEGSDKGDEGGILICGLKISSLSREISTEGKILDEKGENLKREKEPRS